MENWKIVALIITTPLLLSACATTYQVQSECLERDWYATGFDVAKQGVSMTEGFDSEKSACVEKNVWIDRESYQQGYEFGLGSFCTEVNGFEFGQRNLGYQEICPPSEQALFNNAYYDGLSLYQVSEDIINYESLINDHENDVVLARERIAELTYVIKNGNLDDKTKKEYFSDRRNYRRKLSEADQQIPTLIYQQEEARRHRAKLEYTLFDKYYKDGDASEITFSIDLAVEVTNLVISEPAIILYQPVMMSNAVEKHFDVVTKEINSYITLPETSAFRYQMVGDLELVFEGSSTAPLVVNTRAELNGPTLLLWDGNSELAIEKYEFKEIEELVTLVSEFIRVN